MKRLGSLALLVALAGACTATPITLPGQQDTIGNPAYDSGMMADGATADMPIAPGPDLSTKPDAAYAQDSAGTKDGAQDSAGAKDGAKDGTKDGLCLECPLPDGMLDGSTGDAEAGPGPDALADVSPGDATVGE